MKKQLKKNTLTNQQNNFNLKFFEYCQNSDLENIQKLYKISKENKNSTFYYFLKLFNLQPPTIDFFSNQCGGLISLANKGSLDCLSYIISLPEFHEQFNNADNSQKHRFADSFFNAAELGHMNCVQLLSPFIEHPNIIRQTYERFIMACEQGNLNTVIFLTTTPLIKFNANHMINNQYDEYGQYAEAFVSACENGHLNIVKYLVSNSKLKGEINFDLIKEPIFIDNQRIIEYFIFDLNLPKDSQFLKIAADPNILEELLEKRKMFKDLSHELNITSEQSNKKTNKF